jgi:hypothetical protein
MEADSVEADRYFEHCRQQAEKPLDEMTRFLEETGMVAKWRLRRGIPSQQINSVAADCRADLVVLGSYGRTGLTHIALGSTAERVVRGAPYPVLIVPEVQETITGGSKIEGPERLRLLAEFLPRWIFLRAHWMHSTTLPASLRCFARP